MQSYVTSEIPLNFRPSIRNQNRKGTEEFRVSHLIHSYNVILILLINKNFQILYTN